MNISKIVLLVNVMVIFTNAFLSKIKSHKSFYPLVSSLTKRYSIWHISEPLTSVKNDKVKEMKRLKSRGRKERITFLEGHRMIIDAINVANLTPDLLFVTDEAFNAPLGDELLDICRQDHIMESVTLVAPSIIKTCSETVTPQGVIALFNRPQSIFIPDKATHVLLLDGMSDPGNLGTLIRSAYSLGFDSVICVDCADPFGSKAVRASMGACLLMPIIDTTWSSDGRTHDDYRDVSSLLESSPLKNSPIFISQLDETIDDSGSGSGRAYDAAPLGESCVLVVGGEARGVSEHVWNLPHATAIHIPMVRDFESLNAAVAGGILMSEVSRQKRL